MGITYTSYKWESLITYTYAVSGNKGLLYMLFKNKRAVISIAREERESTFNKRVRKDSVFLSCYLTYLMKKPCKS